MRTLLITTALLIAATVYLITSCKKDDTTTTTTTPPTNIDTLCDGIGTTSYYPLDLNNTWVYLCTISGVNQTVTPTLCVSKFVTYNGLKYSYIHDLKNWLYPDGLVLRQDSATHNIYRYNTSNYTEYLEVPASPTLNQLWDIDSSILTRKVTNVSATLKTSACTYTGLLQITEYYDTTVQNCYYYKKGLGMVALTSPGTSPTTYYLSSVTLK